MINMKIFVFIIVTALMSLPCLAQRDIKTFDNMSPDEVKVLYGTPLVDDDSFSSYSAYIIFYEHFRFFYHVAIVSGQERYVLDGFDTDSPQFRILSDYIDGGIKVGDSLERLQSIDFQNSPYGRNKAANALKPTSHYDVMGRYLANYIAFEEQHAYLLFYIEDGIIKAFASCSKEDNPNPNEPYVPIW